MAFTGAHTSVMESALVEPDDGATECASCNAGECLRARVNVPNKLDAHVRGRRRRHRERREKKGTRVRLDDADTEHTVQFDLTRVRDARVTGQGRAHERHGLFAHVRETDRYRWNVGERFPVERLT
jgi:hypothetical protein